MAAINIDDRIFEVEGMDENKFWFLCHLILYSNKDMKCWPSNKTLAKDMGWSLRKMQSVKASLIESGMLQKTDRFKGETQTSNEYEITVDFIGVYLGRPKVIVNEGGAKSAPHTPGNVHPPGAETAPLSINPSEALTNRSKYAGPTDPAFVPAMDEYNTFIIARTGLKAKIDDVQGSALKKILLYLRANSQDKSVEGVVNGLKWIFTHWNNLDAFHRDQLKLTQINSNLINIINRLKNGTPSGSTADVLRQLDDLERQQRQSAGV